MNDWMFERLAHHRIVSWKFATGSQNVHLSIAVKIHDVQGVRSAVWIDCLNSPSTAERAAVVHRVFEPDNAGEHRGDDAGVFVSRIGNIGYLLQGFWPLTPTANLEWDTQRYDRE